MDSFRSTPTPSPTADDDIADVMRRAECLLPAQCSWYPEHARRDEWTPELWLHRMRNPMRPWIQLSHLWAEHPPGRRIPRRLWELECGLRDAVGMPRRDPSHVVE